MNENDTPHSGSRWEPTGHEHAANAPGYQPGEPSAAVPPEHAAPAGAPDAHATAAPGGRRPGRGLLAGAGIGLFVLGGVGGFAVGHAAADDGQTSPAVQQTGTYGGVPGNGTFPGDGDGGGPRDGGARPDLGGEPPTTGGTTGTTGGDA